MPRVDPEMIVYSVTADTRGLPGHLRPQPEPDVCKHCRGDGCPHCDYTGDAN